MAELALLDEVVGAAGGEERWRSARRISAHVRSGGLLPRTRLPGNRFADYTLTLEVDRPHAVLDPYPGVGRRAVFAGDQVSIEGAGGEVLQRRESPRAQFFGLSGLRRNLRWDALDSTYFAGYAMWNYLTHPLLLLRDEVEVSRGPDWNGEGAPWRRLDARFPPGFPTHSPEQSFFYDESGRLVRHDYTPEVVSRSARGAHYCAAHREYDGLMFPTSRRVLPLRRNLRSRRFPTVVWIELDRVQVEREAGPGG